MVNSRAAKFFEKGKLKNLIIEVDVQHGYALDRFTKTFFWNFQNSRAVLCYILIDKQMLY